MISNFIFMNGYGIFVWSSFGLVLISGFILYLKTRKTLKKYEKEFLLELETLPEAKKKHVLENSKIANKIRSKILNDDCDDTGCSLKVFDKKAFLKLPFFDGIHRFLPALFKGFGYKTYFVYVDHRSRFSGKSNYGTFDRLFKGIKDLIRVKRIIRDAKFN